MVEWVVKSNRPLSVVEDEKLMEAFEIADEKFKMPSMSRFRNLVYMLMPMYIMSNMPMPLCYLFPVIAELVSVYTR